MYLQLHPTGCIIGAATGTQDGEGWVFCTHSPLPNDLFAYCYDPIEGFTPRPALPAPVIAGNVVTWADLPDGTYIDVIDGTENVELGRFVVGQDGAAQIALAETGHYLFSIYPPSPWMQDQQEVTVA